MPTSSELIGFGRNEDEIAEAIGADRLFYQKLEDLKQSVLYKRGRKVLQFEASVFDGEYITGDVGKEYFEQLELQRSDAVKTQKELEAKEIIDLHNH
jgi:amidophosphoribosyltransferase